MKVSYFSVIGNASYPTVGWFFPWVLLLAYIYGSSCVSGACKLNGLMFCFPFQCFIISVSCCYVYCVHVIYNCAFSCACCFTYLFFLLVYYLYCWYMGTYSFNYFWVLMLSLISLFAGFDVLYIFSVCDYISVFFCLCIFFCSFLVCCVCQWFFCYLFCWWFFCVRYLLCVFRSYFAVSDFCLCCWFCRFFCIHYSCVCFCFRCVFCGGDFV